ncbi:hypothetical protein RvY_05494 [Ramazzottius varieornatus]|uniref:Shavenoid isoform B-like N-terminal domain-containing protein n=1 Tax=Ramazzottius varieornatus TaxID=947166 RepID=A0A1D1UVS5_RAMVA|nr:hypothetical protein RvY_05494 [Ramazzottius varieornatus]
MMNWNFIWTTLRQTFMILSLGMTLVFSPRAVGVSGSTAPPVRVTRFENTPDRFSAHNSSACDSRNGCRFRSSSSLPASVVEMNNCGCECPTQTPIYQDNTATCVRQVPDVAGCPYGSLSDGLSQEVNPTVHLPAFGHTIRRQINLTFPGEEEHGDAICHIVECQFLSADGWAPFSTIHLGNHYPRFRLVETTLSARQAKPKYIIYNLQWLGSSEQANFLQGRIVLLTSMCSSTKLPSVNLCFLMRIAGTSGLVKSAALMDTAPSSHFNDAIETGVIVAAACGGALGVLYIIVLAMFVASRLRKNKKKSRKDERSLDYHDNMACEDSEPGSAGLPVGLAANDGSEVSKTSLSSSSWSDEVRGRDAACQIFSYFA